jgi:alpha/beta hydrolase fold
VWRDVSPHLQAGGLRTLAVDLPGFGESPAPRGRDAYDIEKNVAVHVLGALDALGVSERVDLVGHDWGAVLGWVLCLRHPGRVRRFVALSVGHPRAYINAGLEQKRKGLNWYRANCLQNVFTRWPKSVTPTLGVWSSEDPGHSPPSHGIREFDAGPAYRLSPCDSSYSSTSSMGALGTGRRGCVIKSCSMSTLGSWMDLSTRGTSFSEGH